LCKADTPACVILKEIDVALVTNPKSILIADANVVAEADTDFKVLVGTQSGGPYTVSSADVPISSLTNNNGTYEASFSLLSFNPPLQNGTTYFAVAQAVNAGGAGADSPEASFLLVSLPAAPTALSFA
jgi:hypothetical protein